MAIRYNKQLQNEIYKAVRSFNAKISRLQSKGVSAALLPDRLSTKSIKANYTNRRQLRTYLKSLQEFTSKGQVFKSEGGVTGTTQLFEYNIKRSNKATRKLQNELKSLSEIPTRYPMMKSENITLLQSKLNYLKRDIYQLDVRQINVFKRNIETTFKEREKSLIFHDNFNKMMLATGYRAGIDKSYLSRLAAKFSKLPPAKLLELYRTNPAFTMVTEKYKTEQGVDIDEEETKQTYEAIENIIDEEIAANG